MELRVLTLVVTPAIGDSVALTVPLLCEVRPESGSCTAGVVCCGVDGRNLRRGGKGQRERSGGEATGTARLECGRSCVRCRTKFVVSVMVAIREKLPKTIVN